ncbi:MAG: AMP-binding protein [Blautia sp.]|nr:AMP-binding protein [Blautia sp.]
MERKYYEMSEIQRNIWDMICSCPDPAIANIGGVVKMPEGMTDEKAKEISNRIQQKNATLRLRLDEQGRFYLAAYEPLQTQILDFRGESREAFDTAASQWFQKPLTLYHAQLCDSLFARREDGLYLWGKSHHLIMDSTSIRQYILCYYHEELLDREEDVRFLNYLEEKKEPGKYSAKMIDQWKGVTVDWRLRENASDGKAEILTEELPVHLTKKLQTVSRCRKVSMESLLSAALYTYIAKVRNRETVAIGKMFINRVKNNLDMMGMMVNTLPVMVNVCGEESYLELCRRIQGANFSVMKCQNLSYRSLRRQSGHEDLLFDICISYRNDRYLPLDQADGGYELFNGCCEIPLRILLNDRMDAVSLSFIYQTANYGEEEVREMFRNLVYILEQGCEDALIRRINIVNPDYLHMVAECNDTDRWTFRRSLWDHFCEFVKQKPQDLLWEESAGPDALTYEEAKEAIDRLAAFLMRQGVSGGDFVGIVLKRDYLLPVAMMAVMKTGAAFLPIGYSEEESIIEEFAGYCKYVISSRELQIPCLLLSKEILLNLPPGDGPWMHRKEAAAYGIFTSGSTGNPKIAVISEESLMCRLEWMAETFDMRGRILQKTVNTFDVSVWELLLPFLCGGRGCLLQEGDERFPDAIIKAMAGEQVEIVHFVPSMLSAVLSYLDTGRSEAELRKIRTSLKYLISSGEALSSSLAERVQRLFPDTALVNLYGPAECTIDVSCHLCDGGEERIPIGYPVWNTQLYVWGEGHQELPQGETGQLVIGGLLVGNGYLNNKEEEKKRFLVLEGRHYYLTGDLAKRLPNGEICYLGRENQETKVRGIRVDLEEMERLILSVPGVERCCLVVWENRICVFYESSSEIPGWRELLEGKLPRGVIPNRFIRLPGLPLQRSGKTDRRKLTEIFQEEEKRLCAGEDIRTIVEGHFTGAVFSDRDNLLQCGLDSISAAFIISDMLAAGYELSYRDFFEHPSVQELREFLGSRKKEEKQPQILLYFDGNGKLTEERISDHVLFAVPYAGSEFTLFTELAGKLWKKGIQLSLLNMETLEKESVWQMAKRAADVLEDIPELSIMGCCVGSAAAIAVAKLLELRGKDVRHLYLCGALPYQCSAKGEMVWDLLGQRKTEAILSVLYGSKRKLTKTQWRRFLLDSHKSGMFFRDCRIRLWQTDVRLIYGERDLLTAGFPVRKHQWEQWLGKKYPVWRIKNAGHYMTTTHAGMLAEFLAKQEERYV